MNSGQPVPQARVRLALRGAVQGVGFRPFVYRLALELGVKGWVSNSAAGVLIEAEASREQLTDFVACLKSDKPPQSLLQSIECEWLDPIGFAEFQIVSSDQGQCKRTWVLPDLATCSDCLHELLDPADRRFGYPFINCTHCGPRFTIIQELPYDRIHTSMRAFTMCPACQAEYDDPNDRRFHAQPNACPLCGPQIELWDRRGQTLARTNAALERAATAIGEGLILAVKGLGGFHLMVAAHRADAIARLRQLKHRAEKPFALLFPSLESIREECAVAELEQQLLCSAPAPIVLVRRRPRPQNARSNVSELVAPGNPTLGVMLPSTPLHHLLMRQLGFPVVATSGNLAEEPICIDEQDALTTLGPLADLLLVHNRPIVRHADDSIVRVMAGREMMLRRARGYAPLPVSLTAEVAALEGEPRSGTAAIASLELVDVPSRCILAVGAHLKNSIALAVGQDVFISQHIGDLESPQAYAAFQRVIADFQKFYEVRPDLVVADAHPDYLSTRYANDTGLPVLRIQHHYAHVLACMGENGVGQEAFGVSWDGTGYGLDRTVWGGEFLNITAQGFERFAHFRTFLLPGGDQAIKEPRRSALGLLYEAFGSAAFTMVDLPPLRAFSRTELTNLSRMLEQKLNSPRTSSAGRLFDAVGALLGMRQRAGFEGQAAMDLEFAMEGIATEESYPLPLRRAPTPALALPQTPSLPTAEGVEVSAAQFVDWAPMLDAILVDQRKDLPAGLISMKFHNSLVELIVHAARAAGKEHIVLSGGCFQNEYLTERAILRLQQAGFRPVWHRCVPPNDGGIALGQVVAARREHHRNG